MTLQLPSAILWDMDGTLVDSEPYWMAAEEELVKSYGGEWTADDGRKLIGTGLPQAARVFQSRGVQLSVDEIVARLSAQVLEQLVDAVPWRPGVLELMAELDAAGIPSGIVTMSLRSNALFIADKLGIEHVVSGDDVDHEKPHPEAYLRGAALFQVPPEACIAFEDSLPGLASASAAGTVAIGVPAHVDLPPSESYTVWPTLVGRTLTDLSAVFGSASTDAVEQAAQ